MGRSCAVAVPKPDPWYDVSELRLDRKHSWSDSLSLLPEIRTDAVLCKAIQFPLQIIQFGSYRILSDDSRIIILNFRIFASYFHILTCNSF
jgi:hypothetical protein